jgi:hypothetical protein
MTPEWAGRMMLSLEPGRLLENGEAGICSPDHVFLDLSSDFPEIHRGRSMSEIFSLQENQGAS